MMYYCIIGTSLCSLLSSPASSPLELPTETDDLAAQLDTHIAVLRLFGGMMMLGREQWQDTGVVDKVALEGARPMPRRRKLRKLDLNIPIRAEGALDTGRPRASKRFKASTA